MSHFRFTFKNKQYIFAPVLQGLADVHACTISWGWGIFTAGLDMLSKRKRFEHKCVRRPNHLSKQQQLISNVRKNHQWEKYLEVWEAVNLTLIISGRWSKTPHAVTQ